MHEARSFPVPLARPLPARRRTLVVASLLCFAAARAQADFDAEVTAPKDFAASFTRVAVVAIECHEAVDCHQVEARIVRDRTRSAGRVGELVPASDGGAAGDSARRRGHRPASVRARA